MVTAEPCSVLLIHCFLVQLLLFPELKIALFFFICLVFYDSSPLQPQTYQWTKKLLPMWYLPVNLSFLSSLGTALLWPSIFLPQFHGDYFQAYLTYNCHLDTFPSHYSRFSLCLSLDLISYIPFFSLSWFSSLFSCSMSSSSTLRWMQRS